MFRKTTIAAVLMFACLFARGDTESISFGDIHIGTRMYTADQVDTLIGSGVGGLTTNDVCNIVTNEVDTGEYTAWTFNLSGNYSITETYDQSEPENPFWQYVLYYNGTAIGVNGSANRQTNIDWSDYVSGLYSSRQLIYRNALGLATEEWVNGKGYTTTNDVLNIVTNDVLNIVTNTTEAVTNLTPWLITPSEYNPGTGPKPVYLKWNDVENGWNPVFYPMLGVEGVLGMSKGTFEDMNITWSASEGESEIDITATRSIESIVPSRNALGFAMLTDIPSTNGFVTASITNNIPIMTTNDVCSIVTNTTAGGWSEWTTPPVIHYGSNDMYLASDFEFIITHGDTNKVYYIPFIEYDEDLQKWNVSFYGVAYDYREDPEELEWIVEWDPEYEVEAAEDATELICPWFTATRTYISGGNALGLAMLTDLPDAQILFLSNRVVELETQMTNVIARLQALETNTTANASN